MATITIDVPDSKDKRSTLYRVLGELGIPFREQGLNTTISQKERLLLLYREKESLRGWSKTALKLRREFRDDFEP